MRKNENARLNLTYGHVIDERTVGNYLLRFLPQQIPSGRAVAWTGKEPIGESRDSREQDCSREEYSGFHGCPPWSASKRRTVPYVPGRAYPLSCSIANYYKSVPISYNCRVAGMLNYPDGEPLHENARTKRLSPFHDCCPVACASHVVRRPG